VLQPDPHESGVDLEDAVVIRSRNEFKEDVLEMVLRKTLNRQKDALKFNLKSWRENDYGGKMMITINALLTFVCSLDPEYLTLCFDLSSAFPLLRLEADL
jgi:hypothetical protein